MLATIYWNLFVFVVNWFPASLSCRLKLCNPTIIDGFANVLYNATGQLFHLFSMCDPELSSWCQLPCYMAKIQNFLFLQFSPTAAKLGEILIFIKGAQGDKITLSPVIWRAELFFNKYLDSSFRWHEKNKNWAASVNFWTDFRFFFLHSLLKQFSFLLIFFFFSVRWRKNEKLSVIKPASDEVWLMACTKRHYNSSTGFLKITRYIY